MLAPAFKQSELFRRFPPVGPSFFSRLPVATKSIFFSKKLTVTPLDAAKADALNQRLQDHGLKLPGGYAP